MKRVSHSQTGQDILVDFILRRKGFIPVSSDSYSGFYLDIGCSHPVRGSNTYFYYERGWRGICIDANPEAEAEFTRVRPEDTFINCGIGHEPDQLDFYIFKNPQHNTFNGGRAKARPASLVTTINVQVDTLSNILARNMKPDQIIDFMSMDIEGLELSALSGMDLDKYRPRLILIESLVSIERVAISPISKKLAENNYKLVAHTGHDSVFLDLNIS